MRKGRNSATQHPSEENLIRLPSRKALSLRLRLGWRSHLARDFLEAEALQQRKPLVARLTKIDLLVIEDFGMKRLGPNAAEDLLEVFVRRHERGSTLVTTNRPTQDWGVFLGDIPAATAILDRFLSHAELVQMQGKSYRMHQRSLRRNAQSDLEA